MFMGIYSAALLVAFLSVLASFVLSFHLISQHLYKNNNIPSRKFVIRIIMMVPIYGLNAWCGVRFPNQAMYFDLLREWYEALVIYSFFQLLVCTLGGTDRMHQLFQNKRLRPHMFPFCWLTPWKHADGSFLVYTEMGILQYVVLKPIMAFLSFVLNVLGVYHQGQFNWHYGYPYIAFIGSCSQLWAMYCLILFYFSCRTELSCINPVPKFIMVKAVVFFTFWQNIAIDLLVKWGVIHGTPVFSSQSVGQGLHSFLICLEMFVAAVCHMYYFNCEDFTNPEAPNPEATPFVRTFVAAMNVTEVYTNDVGSARKRARKHREFRRAATISQSYGTMLRTGSEDSCSVDEVSVSDAIDAASSAPPPPAGSLPAETGPSESHSVGASGNHRNAEEGLLGVWQSGSDGVSTASEAEASGADIV